MRFLRYLFYAVLQLGLFGGLFWLYSLIRGVPFFGFNIGSTGLLTFIVVSFVPIIDMMRRQRKLPLAGLRAIRSPPFVLRARFRGRVNGSLLEVKARLREICNAAVFADRVLVLAEESDDFLEYVTEPRIDEIGSKSKRRRFEATRVEINMCPSERVGAVDVDILSSSDERDVGIDNLSNEENVGAIVVGLREAGFLVSEAPPSLMGYSQSDARDRSQR